MRQEVLFTGFGGALAALAAFFFAIVQAHFATRLALRLA